MKKICFVIPNMSGGGAQRVVSVIANRLSNEVYEVSVLITNKNIVEYDLDKKVVLKIACNSKNNGARTQIQMIRKEMKKSPKTVFISFLDNQNDFTIIAGLGLRNKVIVSQRNDPHQAFQNRKYMKQVDRFLYTLADAAIFQTKDAMEYYPKRGKNKYRVILNPLKDDLPERYFGKRTKRVVTVCRLNKQKNLPLAIDAFNQFRKSHSEFIFEIYGKGELEQELKNYVAEIGLEDAVKFRGFCNNVHEKIVDASIFLISSDFEGLSNSMIESMALGIPTVATDCPIGGARMVISSGNNGYLVPVNNKEKIVEAMSRIADDSKLAEKISNNAYEIRRQLSVDRICLEWRKVIDELL